MQQNDGDLVGNDDEVNDDGDDVDDNVDDSEDEYYGSSVVSNDNEVNDVVDEIAVCDCGFADGKGKTAEIDPTDDQADQWHDDIVDHGGNDLAERSADDDSHGQVDNIAAHEECFEFF